MTRFQARIGGAAKALPARFLCDAWLADGQRFGDELSGLDGDAVLGRWPKELETDAVVRLAQAVGEEPSWDAFATQPPVAQKLAERARPQPLDLEILRHFQHLQQVSHRPRLHLRVEEERLPVSRARRFPVRAVADLVSHPGDWEHRTLRSIQPSRVLARQIEDEWNLYENRVAVRLIDHLLAYLAKRLEELRKIKEILDASRDYSEEMRRTSFLRARRVSELWSSTLESKTEQELSLTLRRLDHAQRDLQVLLDAPLYRNVPRRQAVPLSLKPTNILVNDPHYRKVAALWRAWVKYGHRRQETNLQRAERRRREAEAWDRFVLHLVVRAFVGLGWTAAAQVAGRWSLTYPGWRPVTVEVDGHGIVRAHAASTLHLIPLCTILTGADAEALSAEIEAWDAHDGEVVAVHVGAPADIEDADRATGWSFNRRAVLFACSPWGIDAEERMTRLINGWISRSAVIEYPVARTIPELPELPRGTDWLRYYGRQLVAYRPPQPTEAGKVKSWATRLARTMDVKAQQAKAAGKAFPVAPRNALSTFQQFVGEIGPALAGIDLCPVCGGQGILEPRPGKAADGSDATWWARCGSCGSEWGLRTCAGCRSRYQALVVQGGIDLPVVAKGTSPRDWPDKALGRDVWAQPCGSGVPGEFRCPGCGVCSRGACERCRERGAARG